MSARFEVHETSPGSFHWVLRARNGKVTATGETHRSSHSARWAADAVQMAVQLHSTDGLSYSQARGHGCWNIRGEAYFWQRGGPRCWRRTATLRAWRLA
jgi:uncharacterized protein YegP (UPF0339 family)